MGQGKDGQGTSSFQANPTDKSAEIMHNGLRILARWIVRAYVQDQTLKLEQLKSKEAVTERPPTKINLIKKIPKGRLALTVPETAKLLGVDRGSVYDGVMSGQIPSARIGQQIIIPRAALVKYLSEATKPSSSGEKTEMSE